MTNKEATTEKKTARRHFIGEVVSTAEEKTAHVAVRTVKMNKKYQKQYTQSKKFAVHDEKNEATVGDTIVFEECRPLSKTKRWRLVRIEK